jgi:hypothetical protein
MATSAKEGFYKEMPSCFFLLNHCLFLNHFFVKISGAGNGHFRKRGFLQRYARYIVTPTYLFFKKKVAREMATSGKEGFYKEMPTYQADLNEALLVTSGYKCVLYLIYVYIYIYIYIMYMYIYIYVCVCMYTHI